MRPDFLASITVEIFPFTFFAQKLSVLLHWKLNDCLITDKKKSSTSPFLVRHCPVIHKLSIDGYGLYFQTKF
jgi:hypothetical protein